MILPNKNIIVPDRRCPSNWIQRYRPEPIGGKLGSNWYCPGIHRTGRFHVGHMRLEGYCKLQVLDREKVVKETGWIPNLILNQGMDRVAADDIPDLFLSAAYGDGTTNTKLDSGTTTASQSSTTVTASSSIFVSGDVGNMVKWDSGEEARITSFTSTTAVEVTPAQTVSSAEFTIHRTNQVGLDNEIQRSNSYLTGSGNCGSTISSSVITHRRTVDFNTISGSQTVREVGFSHLNVLGQNDLNTRIFLASPVNLADGQQLRLIYDFAVTYAPTASEAKSFTITGWPVSPATNTDGDQQWEGVCTKGVNTSGSTVDIATLAAFEGLGNGMEPFRDSANSDCAWFLSDDVSAFSAFNTSHSAINPIGSKVNLVKENYASLSFLVDKSGTMATSNGNSTAIRKISIMSTNFSAPANTDRRGLTMLFDEAQTKANTHTLEMVFRWTWGRALVN